VFCESVAILGPDDSGKTVNSKEMFSFIVCISLQLMFLDQTLLENLKALYLGYSPLSPSQIMASQYITLCYD
jgi:hypothetical protein